MKQNKKVLEALTSKVEQQMKSEGLTWDTMQKYNIKTKFGYPMCYSTMYKVIRQPKYYSDKQTKALLNYFNLSFEVVEDVIILK